ncbi:MAG: hypothetical protein IT457_12650 [Planctomycetes bacterium]|nr:hypothetical protein [Planctomycetota bacterium]
MNTSAVFGSLIGFLGWVLALTVLLATNADFATVLAVVPPCLFASLGLWGLLILVVDATRRRHGPASREAGLALAGGILFSIGILLVLVDALVLPRLQANPESLEMLRRLGAATSVAPWVRTLLLAAGGTLLGVLALRGRHAVPAER